MEMAEPDHGSTRQVRMPLAGKKLAHGFQRRIIAGQQDLHI
jgi:hypothetical protein